MKGRDAALWHVGGDVIQVKLKKLASNPRNNAANLVPSKGLRVLLMILAQGRDVDVSVHLKAY